MFLVLKILSMVSLKRSSIFDAQNTKHSRNELREELIVLGQGWIAVGFDQSNVQLSINKEVETKKLEWFVFLWSICRDTCFYCYLDDLVYFLKDEFEKSFFPFFFEKFL